MPFDRASRRAKITRECLTLTLLLLVAVAPSSARVATLTFTGIGQVGGPPGGDFATAGFLDGDIVDMTIQIEETTTDSNGSGTAGTFNDPASITTFSRQLNPAATVSFTGFGFEMADPSRLDQASMPSAPEGTYWVSGVLEDWDVFNINPQISNVNDLFVILRELPNTSIGNATASFAIGAPDDTTGNVTRFTGLNPTVTLTIGCGNGIVDAGEECDDPVCCDSTCDNAVSEGAECRAAAGLCDIAESCSSGACPVDALASAGTECRPSAGDCDMAEECTGSSPDCPPDTLSMFTCGTICRPAQDACDEPDFCDSYANTGNFDCPGSVTLCTPTATATATSTPTATSTATPTATRVPEGGSCVASGDCETGLACIDNVCTEVTVPTPAMSKQGLAIALALLLLAGYMVLRRGRKVS